MAKLGDIEVKVKPVVDWSAVSDDTLDELADLLWSRICARRGRRSTLFDESKRGTADWLAPIWIIAAEDSND